MKNLKGLSITSIVSIILAVAIIGVGIAWWLMSSDNGNINTTTNTNSTINVNVTTNTNALSNTSTASNTNTSVNTNSATTISGCANVADDWLTYTNAIYNYTIQYPADWTYLETDLSAEESATGWPFRYVTFQDADGVYSFTIGTRLVGEDIGVAPRTELGYGEMIAGDVVSIGSTTTTPQIHRVDGTTDVILYYESTSTAPVLSGHDIVAEISSTSNDVLEESVEFQTANSMLCTMEFQEETPEALSTYTNSDCGYSFTMPAGWYAHDMASSVLFLQTAILPSVGATEGYAYGTQFIVRCGEIDEWYDVTTAEEYLDQAIGSTDIDGNPIVRENVVRNGLNMTRLTMPSAGAAGTSLTYYYFDGTKYYMLDHWPYEDDNAASNDFENAINSFSVI